MSEADVASAASLLSLPEMEQIDDCYLLTSCDSLMVVIC